jgi:hypothetical protein
MATKLTLRLSPILIRRAKSYAKQHGKSVSQIVGDYFSLLGHVIECEEDAQDSGTLPLTKSLKGALKGTNFSEKDYKKHLEKKYL